MDIQQKISRVVASCKTPSQLACAALYIRNAFLSNEISSNEYWLWIGTADGIAFERGYK